MSTDSDSNGLTYHTTESGGVRATWQIRGGALEIVFVDDPGSDRAALRWPNHPMPAVRLGHIAFDPAAYPDLDEARELLPEYARLWDAVASDHSASLQPKGGPESAASRHREFFSLPV
jgi:hypothetical protein